MRRKSFTLALAILGAVMTHDVQSAELKAGDKAPPFSLKGSDGKTYELAKLKNAVVVAWYPKAFTGG